MFLGRSHTEESHKGFNVNSVIVEGNICFSQISGFCRSNVFFGKSSRTWRVYWLKWNNWNNSDVLATLVVRLLLTRRGRKDGRLLFFGSRITHMHISVSSNTDNSSYYHGLSRVFFSLQLQWVGNASIKLLLIQSIRIRLKRARTLSNLNEVG